jgi:hypothetical protein
LKVKSKCLKQWIDHNGINNQSILNAITNSGIIIAESTIHPFVNRFNYLKQIKDKSKLGYRTLVEDSIKASESLLSDLECTIAIFYKKDYNSPVIKTLLEIFDNTKQLYKYIQKEAASLNNN